MLCSESNDVSDQPQQSRSGTLSSLTFETCSSTFAINVLDEWRELQSRLPDCPLACSYEWTQTWLEHYGDLVPHFFVVARSEGVVRGIALLTQGVGQTDGPVPVKTLHLGTAGEPDEQSVCVEYNGLCVEEKVRDEFVIHLLEVAHSMSHWDELRLDGFSEGSVKQLFPSLSHAKAETKRCYCFDLRTSRERGEEPLRKLGKSSRGTLRYNINNFSDLQIEWSDTLDAAHAIFDELVELHQARWIAAGEPGAYASERFLNFHRTLIDRLFPIGKVALIRVTSDGKTVGCNQVFLEGSRVLNYQGGRIAYEGKLSPGLVVDYLSIEESMKRGFDTWDFMMGESSHKQRLSTHHENLVWMRLRRPRVKYAMVDTLRKLKHLLKENRSGH